MHAKDTRPWNEYWDFGREELDKQDSVDNYFALKKAFDECAKKIGASHHDIMMAAFDLSVIKHNLYFDEPEAKRHMNQAELAELRERKSKFKSV